MRPPNTYGHVRTHTDNTFCPFLFRSMSTYVRSIPVALCCLCPHSQPLLLPSLFLLLTTILLLVTQGETQNRPLLSSLAHSRPTSKHPLSPVSLTYPAMSQTHPPSFPTTPALGHIHSFSYIEGSDHLLTGVLAFSIIPLRLFQL